MSKMLDSKVSVIIPTYNRAFTIQRSVQSVLNQSYESFEVVVIDDASVDETEKIIHSMKDERIRYIKLRENKGPSVARNEGVR